MVDAPDAGTGGGRRWPFYAVGVIISVGAVVTGVLLAATHPSAHAHRHGPLFVIAFAAVAAVVAAVAVVWSIRRQLNRPELQRLRNFNFSQRRAAIRAVNSGGALTDEQRSIAQAQLQQLSSASTRMRWALPLAVVMFVALAVANTGGLRWLWVAVAVVELLSLIAAVLLFRRQRERLARALN